MNAAVTQAKPAGAVSVLIGLCLMQFLSWGVLYYTLPIAASRIAAEKGWPLTTLVIIFTSCLLVAGLGGPLVGRLLDSFGPRAVMSCGALLGTTGILLSARADILILFGAGWCLVGIAQACTLYASAFAAAGQWLTGSVWPLTLITLAGGLSSPIFAPITAYLVDTYGWGKASTAISLLYGLVAIPAAFFLLTRKWVTPSRKGEAQKHYVAQIVSLPSFKLNRAAFAIAAAGLYGITLNLIPLLQELGFDYKIAAAIFGAVGAGQLIGRLAFIPFESMGTTKQRVLWQLGLTSVALFLVAIISVPTYAVILVALFAGAMRGAQTLSIAKLVSDLWGRDGYATVYSKFYYPVALVTAVSPAAAQLLANTLGSYRSATLSLATLTLLALLFANQTSQS